MSKVLFVADLHIHPHKNSDQRLSDCIKVLDWVFETAWENKIEHIVFLGDLFHNRQKINVAVYQYTFEIFEKWLEKDWLPNIYLLLGNHDLVHKLKTDISSVKPLRAFPNVHIIDKPDTYSIDKHSISFLPYTEDPLSDLHQLNNEDDFKILCAHIAINGAVLNTSQSRSEVTIEHDGDMFLVDETVFKEWDRVFLGHYHGEQKLDDNIEYVGSPLQLSFGEAFQKKHIVIYDLESHETEYIENTFSPKHYIVPQDGLDKYDLTNNFVRIMVDDISAADVVDLRRDLTENYDVGSFKIQQKPKEEADTLTIQDARAKIFDNDKIIEKYLEQMGKEEKLAGLNKASLLKIGKSIMERGE